MARFGSSTPRGLITPTGAVNSFPRGAVNPYTASGITVPAGALDRYFAARTVANSNASLMDVVIYGDSTTYGSGGNYSWVQRLRDRSVSAGFADGGKGMFAGSENQIVYDAPEVNGYVSSTITGTTDTWDNLQGNYFYDDGSVVNHTLTLQFRTTAARLWYVKRNTAGSFTYSVDGGAAVTVNAQQAGTPNPRFVYISGLAANTTHTITVTNITSGSGMWIALSPVNANGIVWQKQAVSGATFNNFFFGANGTPPYTQAQEGFRYQTELGLNNTSVASPNYTGATVDTAYPAGQAIKPILAIADLGFNDLTNSSSTDLPAWTEYVKKFAGACTDAGCDGIVVSGQLPYNANWPTYGAARYNAMKTTALGLGLAFVDLFYPIGGDSLSYAGGTSNPHLTKAQYQTQADFLWDNLLGVS